MLKASPTGDAYKMGESINKVTSTLNFLQWFSSLFIEKKIFKKFSLRCVFAGLLTDNQGKFHNNK